MNEDILRLFKIQNKNVDEDLANYKIELAKTRILAYTNRKELLREMNILVAEYASHLLNHQDREGIASRSEGAISESYITTENGMPSNLETALNKYKLLHVVKHK